MVDEGRKDELRSRRERRDLPDGLLGDQEGMETTMHDSSRFVFCRCEGFVGDLLSDETKVDEERSRF